MEQYDILILTLVGSLTSIILLTLKLCFKSKCSDINLCFGLMKIKREVQFETELKIEDKKESKNNNQPQPTMYPSESNLQQLQQMGDLSAV